MEVLRGDIRNPGRANQVKKYSNLRYRNITPTDLDGYMEYHDQGHVFIELKKEGAELPFGQRLALERLCDDVRKPALLVVSEHNCPVDSDIDVAHTRVVEYRFDREWHRPSSVIQTKQLIDKFITHLDSLANLAGGGQELVNG